MNDRLQVLMNEYTQLRESERENRNLLQRIDMFAIAIISGLLIAITNYNITILTLIAPIIVFLAGHLWSTESIRMLRLSAHIRKIEQEVRRILSNSGKDILLGYEDSVNTGTGPMYTLRNYNVMIITWILYSIFLILFFYLLAISPYNLILRIGLITFYVLLGGGFWGFTLWINRKYIWPKTKKNTSKNFKKYLHENSRKVDEGRE